MRRCVFTFLIPAHGVGSVMERDSFRGGGQPEGMGGATVVGESSISCSDVVDVNGVAVMAIGDPDSLPDPSPGLGLGLKLGVMSVSCSGNWKR